MATAFDPYYKWLGIPASDQPADHYRLLGLQRFEADPEVIQAAADRQMVHVRSYASGPHAELSQRLLNEIAAAKLNLLDAPKKAGYDQALRTQLAAQQPPQPQAPVAAALPVGTPLPVAPTLRTRAAAPAGAVAPQAPSTKPNPTTAIPDDIVAYEAHRSPPKRPSGAAGSKASRKNPYIGVAASAIALVIAAGFVWLRTSDQTRVTENNNPTTAKQDTTSSSVPKQAKSVTPTERPSGGSPVSKTSSTSTSSLPTRPQDVEQPASRDSEKATPPATENTAPDSVGKTKPIVGRFVRVELPRVGTLTLAEVEIYSKGRNIALGGRATQISTFDGCEARRAIDGNNHGGIAEGGQSHTDNNIPNPWWEVDLGQESPIDSIAVYNRTDIGLWTRLDGCSLIVFDSNRNEVFRKDSIPASPEPVTIDVRGVKPKLAAKEAPNVVTTDAVDLLKLIKPVRHSEGHEFKIVNGALVLSPSQPSYVTVAHELPTDYELLMTVERLHGEVFANISATVVVDGHACTWWIDGSPDQRFYYGIDLPSIGYFSNETSRRRRVLKELQPNTISCRVRGRSIVISCNGEKLIDWTGDPAKLGPPAQNVLGFGGWSHDYKITSLKLVDLSQSIANSKQPSTAVAAKAVNLLAKVDPQRDAKAGTWKMEQGVLVAPARTTLDPALIDVPCSALDEYDLTMVVERPAGAGPVSSIVINLWSAESPFRVVLDHNGDGGMDYIDGVDWTNNPTTYRPRNFLKEGTPSTIKYAVRRTGVKVLVDDQTAIEWKGTRGQLSNPTAHRPDDRRHIRIGAFAAYRISKLELRPLGISTTEPGDGEPMPTLAQRPKPVNLFKYIDTKSDNFKNNWRMDGTTLIALGNERRLPIGYSVPDEYDISLVVEREADSGRIGWALWSGEKQFYLMVDGNWLNGRGAGMSIDGKVFCENETYVNKIFLKTGAQSVLTCKIRKDGVTIEVDGRTAVRWVGDRSRLSNHWTWKLDRRDQIDLHAEDGNFKISKLELVPYSGKLTTPSEMDPESENLAKDEPLRAPSPSAEEQQAARKLFRETFADALTKAKKPEERTKLAGEFLARGREVRESVADRYVLLVEARKLAAESGNYTLASEAIDELAKSFDVNSGALRTEALLESAKKAKSPADFQAATKVAFELLDEVEGAADWERAEQVAKASVSFATKSRDLPLVKLAKQRSQESAAKKRAGLESAAAGAKDPAAGNPP